MNPKLKKILLLLTVVNIILGSWFVLVGDLHMHTDVARDFLLLDQMREKFALLGPRTNIPGMFHGPLWMYLIFPAFLIGNGNPVFVGFFWVGLTIAFLFGCYKIAKNLFGELSAWIYVLLVSTVMIRHMNEFFHTHGAMLVAPFFFFGFAKYLATKQVKFLLLGLLMAGFMIQFQMAAGIPFLILLSLPALYTIFKNRKFTHLAAFAILLVPASTFVLFDLRHDFLQLRSALSFITESNSTKSYNLLQLLFERATFAFSQGVYLFYPNVWLNRLAFPVFAYLIYKQIKDKNHKEIYLLFAYLFIGYFPLTIINNGVLLHPDFFSVFPIIFLILASLITARKKELILLLLGAVYLVNMSLSLEYIENSKNFTGREETSWKFQNNLAKSVFQDAKGKEFGFFIYSPDIFGYGPRYGMTFNNRLNENLGKSFEKKPLTYIIYARVPKELTWLTNNDKYWGTDKYWRINKVRINKKPIKSKVFENGYRWEKYSLNSSETAKESDKDFDFGIHFR